MTRLFAALMAICFLIFTWPTSLIGASLTLEEQVQQLSANYVSKCNVLSISWNLLIYLRRTYF